MKSVGSGLALLLALWGLACGPRGGDPLDLRVAPAPAGRLELADEKSRGELSLQGERRPVVRTAMAGWRWRGRVPESTRLSLGCGLDEVLWKRTTEFEILVSLRSGDAEEILEVGRPDLADPPAWLDLEVPMERFWGKEIALEARGHWRGSGEEPPIAWSHGELRPISFGREKQRPNVLLIVVDTLRADRLEPYRYPRETSPAIREWLADPGVVVEHAYSQAPWTLPSMVSMMTGRQPGEILGHDWATYGIPPDVPSLGERFRDLGYRTAAFVGNATLHDGNGFGRGFETFYSPEGNWFELHAEDIDRRVQPWLRAHQHEDFFLYVHYMDPHDPYVNDDLLDGRSPFYPDYDGKISGRHVHGVYRGLIPLDDPAEDVRHLRALYDSEVAHVDRYIGRLLAALDPAVLAQTLVVLTSDHGEELFEHGGWKHGYTLYDEQIRVPLIFRWDGVLPAGSRLEGTVSLVDLLPTLIGATGADSTPLGGGRNLLPALRGDRKLERAPAFAQHLIAGPLRAAAVMDRKKVILFNHREPFREVDDLQDTQWRLDLERLAPRELYLLDEDPGEHDNQAGRRDAEFERLEKVVHHHLESSLGGLRILVQGVAEGATLFARIRLTEAPENWRPYFLADEDRITVEEGLLSMEIRGRKGIKGVVLDALPSQVEVLEARLVPESRLVVQAGLSRVTPGDGPIEGSRLLATAGPPGVEEASLSLWMPPPNDREEPPELSAEETSRRLRALGYLD